MPKVISTGACVWHHAPPATIDRAHAILATAILARRLIYPPSSRCTKNAPGNAPRTRPEQANARPYCSVLLQHGWTAIGTGCEQARRTRQAEPEERRAPPSAVSA